MCGIVGFTGRHQAAPVLLEGLARLEYRGYDSAGLAVRNGTAEAEVVKAKGRLKVLAEKTNGGQALKGCCGIGPHPLGDARGAFGGKRTPLAVTTGRWLPYTTALSRTIRN